MKVIVRAAGLLILAFVLMLSMSSIQKTSAQSQNRLVNPGFESPFTDEGGEPPRAVANGWDAWHVERTSGEPDFQNTQPEYFETVRADRIRNGNNAQRYESFFATHTGGVFQVVPNVPSDSIVTFGVYVRVWSSSLNDEDVSENDGDVLVDVGIDPTGGTDGTSDDIIWSVASEQYDDYNLYTVSAPAESSTVSVWVRSRVSFPVQTSRIFVDDAFLTVEGGSGDDDTPAPTSTTAPTNTSVPTSTTVPSNGVVSPTPDTVSEITPEPTDTPAPTSTPVSPIGNNFPRTESYTVQPGDTVSRIASRFDSSVNAIQQANGLNSSFLIFVGETLVIPVPGEPEETSPTNTPSVIVVTATPGNTGTGGAPVSNYIIQAGDTLSSIARRFNTNVAAIAQLNGIVNPNLVFAGQSVVVPPSGQVVAPTPIPAVQATATPIVVTVQPPPPTQTLYVVQPGDSLFRISLRFGVSVSDLIRANGIVNANRIFTGQQLIIP